MWSLLFSCAPAPVTLSDLPPGCDAEADLRAVQAATEPYADVRVAEDEGYTPSGPCEHDAQGAAMGIHYTRIVDSLDQTIELLQPDILLYVPDEAGVLQLVGVEYVAPALLDGALTFDPGADPGDPFSPPPELFCRPFDGPMEGHTPGQPWHHDLHVWIHHDNPDGIFAPHNPALRCPPE